MRNTNTIEVVSPVYEATDRPVGLLGTVYQCPNIKPAPVGLHDGLVSNETRVKRGRAIRALLARFMRAGEPQPC